MAGIQQKSNGLFNQGILKQDSQVLKQDQSENSLEQECLVHDKSDGRTSVNENITVLAQARQLVENPGTYFPPKTPKNFPRYARSPPAVH